MLNSDKKIDYADLQYLASKRIYSDMQFRLQLDAIDENVTRDIKWFEPTVLEQLPSILSNFYTHMMSFERTKMFFNNRNVSGLKIKQYEHWTRLFGMSFDRSYVEGAVRIGLVHHKINLPLFLYLAGYNRVLCDLSALAIDRDVGIKNRSQLVSSIIKIVSLDMDIAISCYNLAENINAKSNRAN